jgi:hypothetical protein
MGTYCVGARPRLTRGARSKHGVRKRGLLGGNLAPCLGENPTLPLGVFILQHAQCALNAIPSSPFPLPAPDSRQNGPQHGFSIASAILSSTAAFNSGHISIGDGIVLPTTTTILCRVPRGCLSASAASTIPKAGPSPATGWLSMRPNLFVPTTDRFSQTNGLPLCFLASSPSTISTKTRSKPGPIRSLAPTGFATSFPETLASRAS